MTQDGKLYGNYLGIVVANDDPIKSGRVKIFVPSITPTVYNNWNQTKTDKKFKFLGSNIKSDLTDIVDNLKDILPWAECASPLAGETSSGRYNSFNRTATISDSNDYQSSVPIKDFKETEFSQNADGTGEKPANILEKYKFSLKDAFVSPGASGTNKANLYGNNYRPTSYSNKPKGSFSVPPVGSHLWVFFIDGNPMYPVYFAASHGTKEWQSVYEFTDYPDSYENRTPNTSNTDHNVEIYRNKYLINQKGGTLEFVNTDNKEAINLTHYSGSFISLTNPTCIYLATANEQHLVLGDKFETIRGADSYYVDGDNDNTIRGDVYRKIGSLDSSAIQRWKDMMQDIADIKQRFETQRVKDKQLFNSIEQSKSGNYGPCPVCSQNRAYDTLQNNPFGSVGISSVIFTTNEVTQYTQVDAKGVQPPGTAQSMALPSVGKCPVCGGTGLSPSSMGGKWAPDPAKLQLASLIQSKVVDLSKAEADLGLGGHEIVDVTKHKIETIGLVMNDFGSIRVDNEGKIYNSGVYVGPEGVFEKQTSSPLIEYVHVDDLPGGNYTLNVCNRYTLQVGAGGISMKSFGPIQVGGTIINMSGEQVNLASSNEINLDGGKRLTLTSDIMVFKQRQMGQVLVDSSLGISRNLIVGGGAHIEGEMFINHMTAPVEIQETEYTRLYGEANSDAAPASPGGSSGYVIGYVSGFSSDWVTENSRNWTRVYSRVPNVIPTPGSGSPSRNSIQNYDHSHHFRNIPLTLVASNTDLRTAAAGNNNTDRVDASPQNNSKKGP
jgi:hypothetical protein